MPGPGVRASELASRGLTGVKPGGAGFTVVAHVTFGKLVDCLQVFGGVGPGAYDAFCQGLSGFMPVPGCMGIVDMLRYKFCEYCGIGCGIWYGGIGGC